MKHQDRQSIYNSRDMQRRMAQQLAERLRSLRFHFFVTLSTNHRDLSPAVMRRLLKDWDARMNRFIVGQKWHKRSDERLIWYAFLEKAAVNPHWHMIVQLDEPHTQTAEARQSRFPLEAGRVWTILVPTGSADVKAVESQFVIDYCVKELSSPQSFDHFILSREFQNN